MLVVPSQGSLILMESLRTALPAGLLLHLYVNDYNPDLTTDEAALVEATFPGYSAVGITFGAAPFLNGDGQAEIDASPPAAFNSTGPSSQTAYGYWIDNGVATTVLIAERFSSPVNFNAPGQFLQVLAVLTGISAFTG